ncbi:EAL domain-containing protein [Vibrio sp. WJH972]
MDFAEILIVDDEMNIRNALRRELRFKVATVHTAESGTQALEILGSHNIDLIITDYYMPNMTGTELLLEVKQRYPNIPAIMLSGQADLHGVTAAINAEVLKQYVDKPWNSQKLASTIATTLNDHQPTRDRLTQMANLHELDQRLTGLPHQSENGRSWLLVIVDITKLDSYNTTHSKAAGNRLIQKMALAIQHEDDPVWYRVGDKFVTLTEFSAQGNQWIDALSDRVRLACAHTDGQTARCYIGDAKKWAHWCEQILSEAKTNTLPISDNLYWLIQENNQDIAEEYKQLGTLIHDLELGKIETFFQPQLTLDTGEITYCESLVRRRLPDSSYQSPAQFLPLIYKYELDDMLTVVVIQQAVSLLRRKDKPEKLTVSVNITAKQLVTGFALSLLQGIATDTTFTLSDIELEVVESDQIFDYQRALAQFNLLHDLGVTIAMDDFGTGYSGFESLCELPFDVVKIDGRFIRALGNKASDEVILASITDSAKSLNMEVVAEWVEKHSQVDYLKRKGCNRIQGYLVSPPLPADEFLRFINNRVTGAEL